MCFDGIKRLCHIRGKLRKKVWINQVSQIPSLCFPDDYLKRIYVQCLTIFFRTS